MIDNALGMFWEKPKHIVIKMAPNLISSPIQPDHPSNRLGRNAQMNLVSIGVVFDALDLGAYLGICQTVFDGEGIAGRKCLREHIIDLPLSFLPSDDNSC